MIRRLVCGSWGICPSSMGRSPGPHYSRRSVAELLRPTIRGRRTRVAVHLHQFLKLPCAKGALDFPVHWAKIVLAEFSDLVIIGARVSRARATKPFRSYAH
jgi:hypothetical protein